RIFRPLRKIGRRARKLRARDATVDDRARIAQRERHLSQELRSRRALDDLPRMLGRTQTRKPEERMPQRQDRRSRRDLVLSQLQTKGAAKRTTYYHQQNSG